MLRLKSIGIALSIICSLCFVINSHAASITSFSVYAGDDGGSGTTTSASLTADEDISFIDWHINDKYKFSSMHNNGTRSVYVYLGMYSGDIKGKKYRIRAVVSFVESSDEEASYTITVYKPKVTSGPGPKTGAYGYSEVSSLYFNGSSFVMSGSAWACNDTNETLRVTAWFRQQKYATDIKDDVPVAGGLDGDPRRDPPINEPLVFVDLPSNQRFDDSVDSILTEFSIGRLIGENETLFYDAHTHLQVFGHIDGKHVEDNWEADSEVKEFTKDDNPD